MYKTTSWIYTLFFILHSRASTGGKDWPMMCAIQSRHALALRSAVLRFCNSLDDGKMLATLSFVAIRIAVPKASRYSPDTCTGCRWTP